jgi:SNF2 family DNA or RNA helicase
MTYVTRDVPLTSQQIKYYEQLRTQFVIHAAGEEVTAVHAAANMTKMMQVCSGSVYTDTGDVVQFDCTARMNALKEVIDECSNKVLIFVPYTHAIEIINETLSASGYDVRVINGAVGVNRRTEIFNTFQTKPDIKVLIIQPQAASHGVTLHAADTIVYWSPVMSVETYLQCNARVHRGGQKNPSTVIHLQGSNLEKRVYNMLQTKITDHTRLIDLYKEELNG